MRLLLPLALVAVMPIVGAGFPPLPPGKDKKPAPMAAAKGPQGTWELTKLEFGGMAKAKLPAGYKMVVKITDTGFTQIISLKGQERETPEAKLVLNTTKSPPWFDVTSKGATTARMRGIYKVDGDTLVLVYAAPQAGDRPGKIDGELDKSHYRMTFKRMKPEAGGKKP